MVIGRLLRFCACRDAKIVGSSLRRNKPCFSRMDNAADSKKIKRHWGFGATGDALPGGRRMQPFGDDFAMQQQATRWSCGFFVQLRMPVACQPALAL
jgi:hypothetical protein